ncbi:hypothetical protein LXN10_13865 [Arcobacter sp. KX21116]|uniref:c-type cytochrome n=1 Tax=Arcobacter iocasae TaxID=2906515 RepID=UPI0035D41041
MIKKILLVTALSFLFLGCFDKEEEKVTKNEKVEAQAPLKIEIEENKNIKEIKVVQKEKTGMEDKSYYMDYDVKSEYDQNSQPANKDASIRVKPRSIVDANMHIKTPYDEIRISMLVKKLSKDFIVKCSACHNDYANGIIGPSLLNKDYDSIFNSIMKFKKNKNANVLMAELVSQMDEDEIKKISKEIYRFNKEVKELK